MTTEQTEKPAAGNWSVTVNREPPVKSPEKTSGGSAPQMIKRDHVVVKHARLAKKENKAADGGQPVAVKGDSDVTHEQPVPAVAKPAADGSWSVTVDHEPPAKHKIPVKMRHAPASPPAPEVIAPARSTPAKVKFVPVVVCMVVVIAACILAVRQRAKREAAQQLAAQTYATVTGFIARMEDLKKQAPVCQRQLDDPIRELQPLVNTSSPNKDFQKCVENAVLTVKAVEKKVLDVETGEEQAKQALAALQQHPEYQALTLKVSAECTEYKNLQQSVETKCQTLRSLIMAANQRMPSPGKKSK